MKKKTAKKVAAPKKPPPVKKPVAVHPKDKHGHFISKAALAKRAYRKKHPPVKKPAPTLFNKDSSPAIVSMMWDVFRKGMEKMSEARKKTLVALAAAASALGAAAQALAESESEGTAPATPEPAAAPAKKPAKEKPAPEPAKKEETPAAPSEDLYAQALEAAKGYSQVYGREAVVKVMNKYVPEGKKTMQDIPADKLPDFIKELKG